LSKTIGSGENTSPAAVMSRLWPYIRPLIGIVALGLIAMGFVAASEAGIPMLLKPLLDHGFGAHGSASARWLVPLAVVGLAVLRGGSQYASGYLLAYVTNKILLQLRLKMFDRMIHTSAGFFQRETASTIINAIVFEVNQILNVLQSVVVTLVRDSLTVVFLLGYLFILNWRLTLVIAVILPAIGWLVSKINRRLRRLNRPALRKRSFHRHEQSPARLLHAHDGIRRPGAAAHAVPGVNRACHRDHYCSGAVGERPDDRRRFCRIRHIHAAGDLATQASDRYQPAAAARHDGGGTDLRSHR
jgi:ABC-type multidrug transport system fused ATPase/permease subunit